MILSSDGSEGDYGTYTYVRWNMTNVKFDCNLLAAKSILALRKTQRGGKMREYKKIYTESDNLLIISDSKCSMYGGKTYQVPELCERKLLHVQEMTLRSLTTS